MKTCACIQVSKTLDQNWLTKVLLYAGTNEHLISQPFLESFSNSNGYHTILKGNSTNIGFHSELVTRYVIGKMLLKSWGYSSVSGGRKILNSNLPLVQTVLLPKLSFLQCDQHHS